MDILEYAFRSSPTVGSGLDQLARYVRAVSDRAIAEIDIVGDALAFTWVEPAQPHRVEFAFALIVRMAREATSARIAPRRVDFAHRPPESRSRIARSSVRRFDSASLRISLLFSRADLALPLRSADPALSRIVRRRMDKMLKQTPRKDSIGTQVRRVLLDNLTGGDLTAAAIARGLGLSERTLHRRLRAENTSFADILDATRGELAKSLLPEPGIGIGEIAFLLGYSEPSAFHRFFRRWTGSTPLAYRRAGRVDPVPHTLAVPNAPAVVEHRNDLARLAIRPMPPEECGHLRVPAPLRPGERRRPWLIVGKIRRGMAPEQKGRDLNRVRPCGPREWRRSILSVARRDVGARVEKHRRAFDGAVRPVASTIVLRHADVVQQSLVLPVHQVRTHPVREKRVEHVGVCQQVALTARQDRRDAQTGRQEPFEPIPSSIADDHRECG